MAGQGLTRRGFLGRGASAASAVGLGLGLAAPAMAGAQVTVRALSATRSQTYQALLEALVLAPESGVEDVKRRRETMERWYGASTPESRVVLDSVLDQLRAESPRFSELSTEERLRLLRSWVIRDANPSARERQLGNLVAAGLAATTPVMAGDGASGGASHNYLSPN
jgi:hypothetical protein